MARRGRSQFQFTVVELVVLAASFALTSCLVFLLGFSVGRQVASRHGPPRESVARIPQDAAPAARPLGRGERAPAPDPAPVGQPQGRQDGEAGRHTGAVHERAAMPASDSAAPGEEGAAGDGAEAARAAARAAVAPSSYTVQVLATRNRKEAQGLSESLRDRGLDAFVAPVEDASGKWYRVRIGRYHDPASARAMAERCRRELALGQAYVSPL